MGALEAIARATFSLASARRGALVVIGRRDAVAELVRGGVPLGGQVSPEILEAIFRKVSPVHDGATLIEADHIIRVGAILPLAQREDLPARWATRHPAGMGRAERCDALVIVASEERGEATLMYDATFERMPTADALLAALRTLMPAPASSSRQPFFNRRELGLQAIAAVIALAIWSVSTAACVMRGPSITAMTRFLRFSWVCPFWSVSYGLRGSTSSGQSRGRACTTP